MTDVALPCNNVHEGYYHDLKVHPPTNHKFLVWYFLPKKCDMCASISTWEWLEVGSVLLSDKRIPTCLNYGDMNLEFRNS